jgi:predicted MFS family arabinose efflux permease
MMGLLSASTASGSLIFLPLMASLAAAGDWRPVVKLVAAVMVCLLPVVWLLFRESPRDLGLRRWGAGTDEELPPPKAGRPFAAIGELVRASRHRTFWLLGVGFFVCGATTNGLVGTHLIAFCGDHGIPPGRAAGWLAFMGLFDIVGATASGWLSDRYDPRKLLVAYFGLRGIALAALPLLPLKDGDLTFFSVLFGLDWIATVPPTLRLVNATFGQTRGPVIYGWIFAAHQIGAGTAALAAGVLREASGSYAPAFAIGGAMAIWVALLFSAAVRLTPSAQPAR